MDFIPKRFSKDNSLKLDPFQFVLFSGGPRNWIGQNFAMNEEKVVLAKLLRNFTFELVPDHVVAKRLAAVMRATHGILMYAKRRQNVRLLDNDNTVTATKRFFYNVKLSSR